MSAKNILFFADGSQELGGLLTRILNQQSKSSLASLFLEQSLRALQEEWSSLSTVERKHIPAFTELRCILYGDGSGHRHTSLHSVEVVLVQLAYFITTYEQRPQDAYPNAEDSVFVGVCYGELVAAAVSSAQSLHDLIPLAVDAVRLAFRGGILTDARARDIEIGEPSAGSWSATVSRETGMDTTEGLAQFHIEEAIPPAKRAWISTHGNRTVVLSGPPSTLDLLSNYLTERTTAKTASLHRLLVATPCHAPHLYSDEETLSLLRQPQPLKSLLLDRWTAGSKANMLIRCTGSDPLLVTSRTSIFEAAIHDVIAEPILWSDTLSACKKALSKDDLSSLSLRVFGPDVMGKRFASGLGISFSDVSVPTAVNGQTSRPSIAIIGMAGRFPSANSVDDLWRLLREGTDCCQKVPKDRFDSEDHFKNQPFGCFIEKPGLFDPHFFHLSPREAIETDPGQRLSLTTSEEALNSAGFVPNRSVSTQPSRVGTFWGQASAEYKDLSRGQDISPYFITGTLRAFGPGRINYYRKFDGPSMSIDTACSSSMVALNQACLAIWNGDCDTAVVGGSNIINSVDNYKGLAAGHFLSPTGSCKTFDIEADGYCRGEAVASIVVKTLDQAIADNDNVLGVIKAISTNHSSAATSLTRPHSETQETLFRQVLDQAGLCPADVDYVEMHGTGTQVGDSTEIKSVVDIFSQDAAKRTSPLYVGAVKSNIGHGEAASGITSLIKCLLMMREKEIPPHVGVKSGIARNDSCMAANNISVPYEVTDWTTSKHKEGAPRQILLNNFSAAGGNTALILEEPPVLHPKNEPITQTSLCFPFSAKTSKSLREYLRRFLVWIKNEPIVKSTDIAYTLGSRRIHYSVRECFIASTVSGLCQQLEQSIASPSIAIYPKASQTVFAFTGYAEAHLEHYGELFKTSRIFKSEVSRLSRLAHGLGFDATLSIFETAVLGSFVQNQLANIISQIAMTTLLRSWSVLPSMVIGHSLGEYAALCAAGMLSPSDAIYLVGSRAQALEQKCALRSFGMLAIRCSAQDAQSHLGSALNDIEISCENGPTETVVSGPISRLVEIEKLLKQKGVTANILSSPLAFHSSQMDLIMGDIADYSNVIRLAEPQVPFFCPLANKLITKASQMESGFFERQTRECVKFGQMLSTASQIGLIDNATVWIELGPHSICTPMIKSVLGPGTRATSLLRKNESAENTFSRLIDLVYKAGGEVDWTEYLRDPAHSQKLLDLPPYAFEEQNLWKQRQPVAASGKPSANLVPRDILSAQLPSKTLQKLTQKILQDGFLMLTFESDLNSEGIRSLIKGHVMNDTCLCPASLYADIVMAVANYLCQSEMKSLKSLRPVMKDLDITSPIIVPKARPTSFSRLRIIAHCDLDDGVTRLRFETLPPSGGTALVHAKCTLSFEKPRAWQSRWMQEQDSITDDISHLEAGLLKGSSQRLLHSLIYRLFDNVVAYEPKFQSMNELLVDVDKLRASATLNLYKGSESEGYACCPFWMDGFAHIAGFILNGLVPPANGDAYISPGWESFRMVEDIDPKKQYRIFVRMEEAQVSKITADCFIMEANRIVGEIRSLKFQAVSGAVLNQILPGEPCVVTQAASKLEQQQQQQNLPLLSAANVQSQTTNPTVFQPVTKPYLSRSARLLEILGAETGIPARDIGVDTPLCDLGVDSLLSFGVLSRMREEFDSDIPTSLLTPEVTVSSLQIYVENLFIEDVDTQSGSSGSSTVDSVVTPPSEVTGMYLPSDKPISAPEFNWTIQQIIAEQLGMEPGNISDSQDLTEIGMDSLMALEVVDALSRALDLTLDSASLLSNTSIAEIDKALSKVSDNATKPAQQEAPSTHRAPPLSICLQGDMKQCKKTLFMFPDGSGSAAVYTRLPRVDKNLCIQGLNSPFLRSNTAFNLADVVNTWVGEIKRHQPHGPYRLGGWSSGGYYAYEAAKVLQNSGETVETLICIDTPSRTEYEAMPEDVLQVLAMTGVMGDQDQAAPQWLVDHFTHTVRTVSKYIPTPMSTTKPPKTYLLWAADGVSSLGGDASSSPGFGSRIAKFFMSDAEGDLRHGWDSLVPLSNLRVGTTPGTHFDMIFPPNAEHLSRNIAAALADKKDVFSRLG